ncbi:MULTISPECIES: type IV secretion system protein [unclassified Novosphingobium]|uniref:type IV secretion system protein n=2 Tax=unclassified Novosphingobium TaxID=2644732 RepID=UPI0006B94D7C|nr:MULTISPECIES: type IV secretion system protein [unclassified Novosphingobium]MBB3376700.1 type IV secretion system protein VirB6 [Novosphingobium sp. BK280]MBB3623055.1 type IV secretion system protein VirB6 [Novosphingobium sp. BK592]MBB3451492.1 type IV secretion system protein VirB6 [Novosphingobium sp. BK352]MBB3479997.1 type IV secretion system protein VirB6 [Novosphingobium sp. BK369]MBB3503313.1 type IV secretion system protein VirB6 [Novosphingobium sp. BK336]
MACPSVTTGQQFLSSMLAHVDCQATTLGSVGFQSLAQPGGLGQTVVTTLLTLLIATFAIRLLAGCGVSGSDLIGTSLKVGIALTLAASWPAFRIVIYDLVLHGPAELAAGLHVDNQLPGMGQGMAMRLQAADDGIMALTTQGTGREVYAPVADGGTTFKAIALDDHPALGWARVAFLVGTLGPLVAIRLVAGLLLALAPVMAGALWLGATRGLFAGWARGLVLCLIGSLGLTVVYAAELAVLEPWLAGALQLRDAGYATPAAPTELLVITLSFAIAALILISILGRVAFQRGWADMQPAVAGETRSHVFGSSIFGQRGRFSGRTTVSDSPALLMAESSSVGVSGGAAPPARVPILVERERTATGSGTGEPQPVRAGEPALGETYRRATRRVTAAGQRRDGKR